MEPGKILKQERLTRDMSQRELEKASGVPQSRISEFESGVRKIGIDAAQQLAVGLSKRYKGKRAAFQWTKFYG